jgi:hypothetical protein
MVWTAADVVFAPSVASSAAGSLGPVQTSCWSSAVEDAWMRSIETGFITTTCWGHHVIAAPAANGIHEVAFGGPKMLRSSSCKRETPSQRPTFAGSRSDDSNPLRQNGVRNGAIAFPLVRRGERTGGGFNGKRFDPGEAALNNVIYLRTPRRQGRCQANVPSLTCGVAWSNRVGRVCPTVT